MKVVATDASEAQIASAHAHPQIEYRVAPAESSRLAAAAVDLITVAQALHWFDIDRFLDEACRVLKPGGVLAVWCYERCRTNEACNTIIEEVFDEVEAYWPPERDIVEDGYRSITLPLTSIDVEQFDMQADWSADAMLAYMRTWSASQRYMQSNGRDPTAPYAQRLKAAWGDGPRTVSWQLRLKAGRAPA